MDPEEKRAPGPWERLSGALYGAIAFSIKPKNPCATPHRHVRQLASPQVRLCGRRTSAREAPCERGGGGGALARSREEQSGGSQQGPEAPGEAAVA